MCIIDTQMHIHIISDLIVSHFDTKWYHRILSYHKVLCKGLSRVGLQIIGNYPFSPHQHHKVI